MELRYPASLPCPQTSEVRSKERRLMTEEERSARQYRPLQRNDVQLESLTFMFRTFEQSAEFMRWWKEELHFGGAWFSADWPLPQGGRAVRKFVSAPSLPTFMPTVGWTLSIVAEVRGEGLADVFGGEDAPRGWSTNPIDQYRREFWTFANQNYTAILVDGGGE
jgi:hypothetical protein